MIPVCEERDSRIRLYEDFPGHGQIHVFMKRFQDTEDPCYRDTVCYQRFASKSNLLL